LKEAPQIEWQQVNSVEELEDSKRSVGGYGHTGTK
jgi:dUTPase